MKNFLKKTLTIAAILFGSFGLAGVALAAAYAVGVGGTGNTTLTGHSVLLGNGSSPITNAAPGTSGFVLTSNGAAADPSFKVLPTQTVYLGTTSPWTTGQLAQVASNGTVKSIATSSLGLLTTDVAEGTNLYYTNTRFDNRLSATTSLPNITTLANLGTIKTSLSGIIKAASGVLSAATSGTDYAPATSGSSILKGNGAGGFSNAVASTDYAPATSGSALLKGNGSGGFSSAANGTDYTLLTANTCSVGSHVSAITAAGIITCSADTGSGGSSGLATSSPWTGSGLAYRVSDSAVSTVATTTLSGNSQISISGTPVIIGGTPLTLSITGDSIGDSQLAFNTGQNLTTASSPAFAGATIGSASGIAKLTSGVVGTATAGTDYENPLTFSTGLTRSTNTITVNTTQNISTLSNLTGNGLVKTSGGTGALSIASAGTDYAPATSGSSILKGNGSGGFSNAVASTDYAPATSGSSLLYGNGSGGFSNATVGTGLSFAGGTLTATASGANTISTTSPISVGNLAYFTGVTPTSIGGTATSTRTFSSEFGNTGTLGYQVGGTNSVVSLATNGTALSKLVQIGANTILGNATGATGNVTAFATSSLGIALGDTTGTLSVARGGTGANTLTGLLIGNGTSAVTATAGTTCTNQFLRAFTSSAGTCATVANTDLANSTISGVALGSNLANLTATDSTLTFSGAYNGNTARTVGVNLANPNSWTGLQQFANSSSTASSAVYASSTNQYVSSLAGNPAGGFVGYDPNGKLIATTTPGGGGANVVTLASGSIAAANTQVVMTSIPATYDHLVLYLSGVSPSANSNALQVQVSTDNGASYDTSAGSYLGNSVNATPTLVNNTLASLYPGGNLSAADANNYTVHIDDYFGGANICAKSVSLLSSGSNILGNVCYIGSTSAMNALRIKLSGAASFDGGTYALYGVK